MSAIVSVIQSYGESYAGVKATIGKLFFTFLPIDDGTESRNNYPLVIPPLGINYSFELILSFRLDYPPENRIYNFLVWSDGNIPEGFKITANETAVSEYTQPKNTESSQGVRADFNTKTTEENSISVAGELVEIGDESEYLVLQLEVLPGAEVGSYDYNFFVSYWEE